GFFYIALFFRAYASLAIGLLALLVFFLGRRVRSKASVQETMPKRSSPLIAAGVAAAIYLLFYVARVGGDFMFARFMIPVLPLLYFILEASLNRLPKTILRYRTALCLIFIGSVIAERQLREHLLFHYDAASAQLAGNWNDEDEHGGETHGIADERWVYTRDRFIVDGAVRGSLDTYREIGKFYEPFFQGIPVKAAISGGQNS